VATESKKNSLINGSMLSSNICVDQLVGLHETDHRCQCA